MARLTASLSFVVLYKFTTMYTLQYWHGGAAEWRPAGYRSDSYEATLQTLRDNQVLTGYNVRFRILMPVQ